MTKGTREKILEHADQALNDMLRAHNNLLWLEETYGEIHPDYRDAVKYLDNALEDIAKNLTLMRSNVM
jgi:hypothetical protein